MSYKNNKNLKHKKHKIMAQNFNIFFPFMHQILFKAYFFEKWSIDPLLGILNFLFSLFAHWNWRQDKSLKLSPVVHVIKMNQDL